ncbi:MAG: TrkH family potassium uptake protein [Clostridiales bacterium]|nr:TrkH family potassium uptake protein [Clostridiales bacterium]
MNLRVVLKMLGNVLLCLSALMAVPLAVSAAYLETGAAVSFLAAIGVTLAAGIPLRLLSKPKGRRFYMKEGLVAVAASWFALSAFGALPFLFSGQFSGYMDCFFEAASGFTTTGASVLTDVERLPRGILFWRGFTQWIGGMGVLVFMLSVLPRSASLVTLMKAESPGPLTNKVVPKLRDTAKRLYAVYIAMSVMCLAGLLLSGLPPYDAVLCMFGTAGTGGFSAVNAGIGSYGSFAAEMVVLVFMMLFATNFGVYFLILRGDIVSALKDEETRFFYGAVLLAAALIAANTLGARGGSALEALRCAVFQAVSISSSAGYATTDYNLWPSFSKCVLVLLMIMGASAGSTGGGAKAVRVLTTLKMARAGISKLVHPGAVRTIKLNGRNVDNAVLTGIAAYTGIYAILALAGTLLVSLDGMDLVSCATAVISCVSNIGPGLEAVGPTGNFAAFGALSKAALSFLMIAGRLEFLPVLALFVPSIWRRNAVA